MPKQIPRAGVKFMFNSDFSVAEISVSYSQKVAVKDRFKIEGSQDVFNACTQFWPGFDHIEYFYVMYLNRGNHVLGVHQVSKGGFTGTVVDLRVIFQVALKACATSIIAIHNHPSGTLFPSDADKELTTKIKQAGKFLEIQLLDHLIITSEKFFSLADNGLI